ARDRILDIQQRRHLAAHPLAVAYPYALGLIDEQPQHSVRASRGIFELHELVSQPLEQGLNEDDEPLTQDRHRAHPLKANRRPNKNGPQGPSRKTKSPSGGFGSQALGTGSKIVSPPEALAQGGPALPPVPHGRGPRGR